MRVAIVVAMVALATVSGAAAEQPEAVDPLAEAKYILAQIIEDGITEEDVEFLIEYLQDFARGSICLRGTGIDDLQVPSALTIATKGYAEGPVRPGFIRAGDALQFKMLGVEFDARNECSIPDSAGDDGGSSLPYLRLVVDSGKLRTPEGSALDAWSTWLLY